MKGFKIDVSSQTVTEVDYTGLSGIYENIDASCFDVARLPNGESVYIDDEGLLVANEETVFFMINGFHSPLAGNGLYVGRVDGQGNTLAPESTIEEVRSKIRFMSMHTVRMLAELGLVS